MDYHHQKHVCELFSHHYPPRTNRELEPNLPNLPIASFAFHFEKLIWNDLLETNLAKPYSWKSFSLFNINKYKLSDKGISVRTQIVRELRKDYDTDLKIIYSEIFEREYLTHNNEYSDFFNEFNMKLDKAIDRLSYGMTAMVQIGRKYPIPFNEEQD